MDEWSDEPVLNAAAERLGQALKAAQRNPHKTYRWWKTMPGLKPGSALGSFIPRRERPGVSATAQEPEEAPPEGGR